MFNIFNLFGGSKGEEKPAEGPLSEAQIDMIQGSFQKVAPIADAAATIFYTRLFEIAPEVKSMFPGEPDSPEMANQGKNLLGTLGVVVNGLRDLDAIVPVAQELAKKHIAYGVKADHYQPVGEALIYTLDKGLGDDFTPELKEAWLAAYTTLSSVMIEAAYGSEAA